MRANTGGRALVLPCPQCATRWSTEQTLAGHLMDAHGMDASPAAARAMVAARGALTTARHPLHQKRLAGKEPTHEPPEAPATQEERPMTNETYTCSKCHIKGHNAR